jgi:regulator of cell morphogenesis and NO signaling
VIEAVSIQQLVSEHNYSEERFAALDSLLDDVKLEVRWSQERSDLFESFSDYFRLDLMVHMRKEDEVLYPALEEFLPRDIGPLMVLRTEHDDICSNFNRMHKAYELMAQGNTHPEVIQKFLYFGRTLLQLLRDHSYKEERVLFPMVARLLKPEADSRIAADMETLERCARENVAVNRES